MKDQSVVVIGAGKMGLPLACQIASMGGHVTACDVSQRVVDIINRGECPFEEPGVPELLKVQVEAGRLKASTNTTEAVRTADMIIIIVPVHLTESRHADLGIIEDVTRAIAAGLQKGAMVTYETTLPVGTTRGFIPLLEESGLKAGVDFDLVFSPERVKSKLVLDHLAKTPKIVGGLTEAAGTRAAEFYTTYLGAEAMDVGSLEASEFAKLSGMVYRDANIAIANELSRYAEALGIDYARVAKATNTDGEAYLLSPGIGVGGHCTPLYPYFLIRDAEERGLTADIPVLARKINDGQAEHLVSRLERAWQSLSGKRVTILGLGFRPGVKEHTLSPAFIVQEVLKAHGAVVSLNDSLYSDDEIRGHGFTPSGIAGEVLVLVTQHPEFADLDFATLKASGVEAILDGRAFWNPEAVRAAGLFYLSVGRS